MQLRSHISVAVAQKRKKKEKKKKKIDETKTWFLKKTNKIDKPLAKSRKKSEDSNKIRIEIGDITTNNTE